MGKGMAWQAWHSIGYGLAMHGILYGIAWWAWHGMWNGLVGMARHMVWPGGHKLVQATLDISNSEGPTQLL